MNRLLLACVLIVSLACFGHARAQALPVQPVDSIVAVVDEDVILRSDLDRAVSTILSQYADQAGQLPPRDVLEKQVLERLILLRLQLARAESAGVRVSDAEVEQTMRLLAQQNRMTMEQLRAQVERDGLNYEQFRQTLREELIAQRLRQGIVQSRVSVSDTEVDIALASDSLQRGRVRIANILVAVPEGATQEQLQAGRTKIEGIQQLINDGTMDFATAAIRYSDAPNALEGGDLGWRSFDEIPQMFATLLQGMQPGQVSQPVRGPSGFHMVKLLESSDGAETITEYQARTLMVRPTEMLPPEQARARLEGLRARIVAGEDFGAIAREHSDDRLTRADGGDLGWIQPYVLGPAFGDQLTRMADGEVSPVFQTEMGFHIVQRVASRQQDITEDARRQRAREAIGRRKAEDEYERFLRQLRDEAYIESRLGA